MPRIVRAFGTTFASTLPVVLTLCALFACGGSDPLEAIRVEHAQGRWGPTIEPLRELVRQRPGDAEVLFLYGRTLSATGQATLAQWSLREAMKDPDWIVQAGLQLAADAARSSNYPAAIEAATLVLEVEPDNISALLVRANAYTHSRMYHEEALADVERILELAPDNYEVMEPKILALIGLERIDEVAKAIEELGRMIDEDENMDGATGWHCATTAIFASDKGDDVLAAERWETCLEAHPADPEVVNKVLPFLDRMGRYSESVEILRKALELAPNARGYRVGLAERLRALQRAEEAEQVLLAGTKLDLPQVTSAAWLDLAKHYQAVEDYEAAAVAVEKSMEIVEALTDPTPTLLLEYADALLIAGEHDRALEIADEMTYAPHQEMIRARVAQEQRNFTAALEHFEKAFVLWPDNPFARYHAARAAEALGDFDRAVEQYRYSIRISPAATDARTRVARIHLAQNRPGEAIELLRIRAEGAPLELGGELLSLELWARTGRGTEIDRTLAGIRTRTPAYMGQAVASVAKGVRHRAGPAAAVRTIASVSEFDPTSLDYAEAIRALIRYSIEANAGRDKAEESLAAAVAANPDAPAIRGIVALELELTGAPREEVRRAYNAVLEVGPETDLALEALGRLAAEDRDWEAALSYYDRAAAANPFASGPPVEAARALAALERTAEAEKRLDELMDNHQFDAPAALLLAQLQLDRQEVTERTLDLARRAVRFGGGAEALQLLARVHDARGETDEAGRATEQARSLLEREAG
ncbi:MAG: tetratricopeptide repeat protein [bacterium]|nr:tetratricopeptide repeat protein [bacterium]